MAQRNLSLSVVFDFAKSEHKAEKLLNIEKFFSLSGENERGNKTPEAPKL